MPCLSTATPPQHILSLQVRRLSIDGVNPRELDFRGMAVVSSAGAGVVQFRPRESYGWVTPLVMRRTYAMFFKAVPEFQVPYPCPCLWMTVVSNVIVAIDRRGPVTGTSLGVLQS